jgi:SAM-dependent methyltransferase
VRHVSCDLCGSDRAELFAERPPRADVLHRRFVRCSRCGLIYADPRGSLEEVSDFYARTYDESASIVPRSKPEWDARVEARARHLRFVLPEGKAPGGSRFLDLGFGDGSSLVAADSLGYDAEGFELSTSLVRQAQRDLGLEGARYGDIATADLPDACFDLVYSWHTIEHVLDVRGWLGHVRRILKPGGFTIIGTESSGAIQGKLWCGAFRALGRTPWPPTSTDHTYWFSAGSLAAFAREAKLTPVQTQVYENGPIGILRGTRLRGAGPKGAAATLLYAFSAALSQLRPAWGGKQILIAQRR